MQKRCDLHPNTHLLCKLMESPLEIFMCDRNGTEFLKTAKLLGHCVPGAAGAGTDASSASISEQAVRERAPV